MNDKNILVVCLTGNEQDAALVAASARLAGQIGGQALALCLSNDTANMCIQAGAGSCAVLPYIGADDLVLAKALAGYCKKHAFCAVLCNATVRGRAVMPMAAVLLQTGLTADCTSLELAGDGTLTQIRPAFGSNVLARIVCSSRPQMATVRPGIYPPASLKTACTSAAQHKRLGLLWNDQVTQLAHNAQETQNALATAQIVVAAGMGVGGKPEFKRLASLAKQINAGFGATRAAVNAGYVPYRCQIGQTGVVVRPKLYIAVGISGAVQHLVGMSGAQTVFAINSDAKAPIFDYADYGVVGDWKNVFNQVKALL